MNSIIKRNPNFLYTTLCSLFLVCGIPLLAGAQVNRWRTVANDYMSAGAPDKATVFFIQATNLDPSNGQIRAELAYSLQQAGRYDDALKEYTLALGLINPPILDIKYNMGIIYAAKKAYKDATHLFNEVLELDPTYASAYLNRANMEVMKQDYTSAKKDYEVYLTGDIKNQEREQIAKMLEILSTLQKFPTRAVDKTQYKEKQKLEQELNENRKRLIESDDSTNTFLGAP